MSNFSCGGLPARLFCRRGVRRLPGRVQPAFFFGGDIPTRQRGCVFYEKNFYLCHAAPRGLQHTVIFTRKRKCYSLQGEIWYISIIARIGMVISASRYVAWNCAYLAMRVYQSLPCMNRISIPRLNQIILFITLIIKLYIHHSF